MEGLKSKKATRHGPRGHASSFQPKPQRQTGIEGSPMRVFLAHPVCLSHVDV
jgi:hypothetical protein